MFSFILELIEKFENMRAKKAKKAVKDKTKKEEQKIKVQNKGTSKSSSSSTEIKIEAKKSKKVKKAKSKVTVLRVKVLVLRILKYIISFIEAFVQFLLVTFGALGLFIILVVLILMLAIYGFLHVDFNSFNSDVITTTPSDTDCVQGGEVLDMSNFDLSVLSQLSGTLSEKDKNNYKALAVYNNLFTGQYSKRIWDSTYDTMVSNVGIPDIVKYTFGFASLLPNTDFENNGQDIYTTATNIEKQAPNDSIIMGLYYDNTFNGTYKENSTATPITVVDAAIVDAIKNKYTPLDQPTYENNFIPYAISTQAGLLGSSMGVYFADVPLKLPDIFTQYKIEAGKDKLTSFVQLFAGTAAYSGSTEDLTNLYSLWCALWAATNTVDASRGFDKITVYSSEVVDLMSKKYILGSEDNTINWDGTTSGYFSVNGVTVNKSLWAWVRENCGNTEYFNTTAKKWLDDNSGTESVNNAHIGLLSYMLGSMTVKHLADSMPVSVGGTDADCDCNDSTTVGNRQFNVAEMEGKIQGDWSEATKKTMLEYSSNNQKWSSFFGTSDSLQTPTKLVTSQNKMTVEDWRLDSKWKIPYQFQDTVTEPWYKAGVKYGDIYTYNGCHIYMCSNIASALTGKFINFPEMFAALRAKGGVDTTNIDSLGWFVGTGAALALKELGIDVIAMNSSGVYATGAGWNTKGTIFDSMTGTAQEKVNYVLDNGGIVGINVRKGSKFTNTEKDDGGHFFVISEYKDGKYKTWSANIPANDIVLHTWDELANHLRGNNPFFLAYKDTGSSTSGSSTSGSATSGSATLDDLWYKDGMETYFSSVGRYYYDVAEKGDVITIPKPAESDGKYSNTSHVGFETWVPGADNTSYQWRFQKAVNNIVDADLEGMPKPHAFVESKLPYDSEGFGKVNGRYVVAVRTIYGFTGDYIDVYLESGLVIPCIIGDSKSGGDRWSYIYPPGCVKPPESDKNGNSAPAGGEDLLYGHASGDARWDNFGKENYFEAAVNVVEFILKEYPENMNFSEYTAKLKSHGIGVSVKDGGNVVKIVNLGSYFEDPTLSAGTGTNCFGSVKAGDFVETPGKFQGPWGDLTEYVNKLPEGKLKENDLKLLPYVGLKPIRESDSNYLYDVDKWKIKNGKGFVRYSQTGSLLHPENLREIYGASLYGWKTAKKTQISSAANLLEWGCGAYVASGVLSTYLGKYITPPEILLALDTYGLRNNTTVSLAHNTGGSLSVDNITLLLKEAGLKVSAGSTKDGDSNNWTQDSVDSCLNSDGMVIVVVSNGLNSRFANVAHYIVIREKQDTGYLVYSSTNWATDSNDNYCNTTTSWEELCSIDKDGYQLLYITP